MKDSVTTKKKRKEKLETVTKEQLEYLRDHAYKTNHRFYTPMGESVSLGIIFDMALTFLKGAK